ncbi:MAG: hypothetical protein H7315_19060 [Herminiimonas sp.]|nr:hypothetical protein [Herminiimonas sp.]
MTHVSEVNAKMDGVVVSIREVANNMRDIAAATMQQSAGLEQISASIGHLDDITHDNNAVVEAALSNAGELEVPAMVLSETASAFHLR